MVARRDRCLKLKVAETTRVIWHGETRATRLSQCDKGAFGVPAKRARQPYSMSSARCAAITTNMCCACWVHNANAASRWRANPARYHAMTHPNWSRHCALSVEASDQLCSKRLKAAWPLPHYGVSFHPLTADTLAMLDTILAATIDRLLQPIRAKVGRICTGWTECRAT